MRKREFKQTKQFFSSFFAKLCLSKVGKHFVYRFGKAKEMIMWPKLKWSYQVCICRWMMQQSGHMIIFRNWLNQTSQKPLSCYTSNHRQNPWLDNLACVIYYYSLYKRLKKCGKWSHDQTPAFSSSEYIPDNSTLILVTWSLRFFKVFCIGRFTHIL